MPARIKQVSAKRSLPEPGFRRRIIVFILFILICFFTLCVVYFFLSTPLRRRTLYSFFADLPGRLHLMPKLKGKHTGKPVDFEIGLRIRVNKDLVLLFSGIRFCWSG